MKIYMMITTSEGKESLLFTEKDKDKKWWSITPDKEAQIVKSKKECELYDTLYAIEYDVDDMPMYKLLKILHKKLSKKEVEIVCKKEKWLEERYSDFLQNPFNDKRVLKELRKIEEKTDSATSMAALASFTSILN